MIQTLFVLYVLAALDALFSGISAASGRNALIRKRAYFARAMLYGFAWGQAACCAALVILYAAAALAAERDEAIEEMASVGRRMAVVYSVYAAVVLVTFAIRAIPSVDVRSMTSVVVFGPLTLVRPAVIVAGVAWGLALAPGPGVVVAALLIAGMMVPFRAWLNLMLDVHGDRVLHSSRPTPRDGTEQGQPGVPSSRA
jgi:hypothetical protein